jgi:hypothetical protein
MNMVNESEMQQHVSILGWLFIVGNALFLLIGGFVFTLLTGLGQTVIDPEARAILPLVGSTVGLLLALLSVPGLAAGYGLLTRKPWARVLGIVVAVLGLFNFPVGTAIGIYALWVLLQTSTANCFGTSSQAQGQSARA